MGEFDVSVALSDFLADPTRTTLELPPMSAEERKRTKALVDKYPELQSESFGFGAERQLHLFKRKLDSSSGQGDTECSTNVSTEATESCSSTSSPQPASQDAGTTQAVPYVSVRNTFVHYETPSVDERTVQSMPHGMFGKCMMAEMVKKRDSDASPLAESKAESQESNADKGLAFSPGTLVCVEGLVKAPAFNGRTAVVQGWDDATSRYRILMDSSSGSQQAMVKEDNLRLVLPCP